MGPYLLLLDEDYQPTSVSWKLSAQHGVAYTRAIGIGPSMNTVVVPVGAESGPAPAVGNIVNLYLTDPVVTTNTLLYTREKIVDLSLVGQPGSQYWVIRMEDARWIIRGGELTGYFNQPHSVPKFRTRDQNGNLIRPELQTELIQGTLQKLDNPTSLFDLAELCFIAMGISPSDFDATQLTIKNSAELNEINGIYGVQDPPLAVGHPLPIYPPLQLKFANPANEIESVLSEYGFAVTLWTNGVGALGGKLVVIRLGEWHPQQAGGFAPTPQGNFWEQFEDRKTDARLPDNVAVAGGRIVIEEFVELEAVGLDLDGQVRTLDKLSYNTGIGTLTPYGSLGLVGSEQGYIGAEASEDGGSRSTVLEPISSTGDLFTGDDIRAVAAPSVWKWYRLPKEHWWRLPLLKEITDFKNAGTAIERKGPTPYITWEGPGGFDSTFYDWTNVPVGPPVPGEPETFIPLLQGFVIDYELGIVKFEKMMQNTSVITQDDIDNWGNNNPPTPIAPPLGQFKYFEPIRVKLRFAYESGVIEKPLVNQSDLDDWDEDSQGDTPEIGDENPDPASWLKKITEGDFYTYNYVESGASTTEFLRHPELVLFFKDGATLNLDELDAAASVILREYLHARPDGGALIMDAPSGVIPGLHLLACDGFLRQITWNHSADGTSTNLEGNREKPVPKSNVKPFEEQLFRRKTSRLLRGTIPLGFQFPNAVNGRLPNISTVSSDSAQLASMRPSSATACNIGTDSIPAFAFIRFTNKNLGAQGTTLSPSRTVDVTKPSASNTFGWGVTLKPIAKNGNGPVAHGGFVYVKCAAIDTVKPGDFVSPGSGSTQDEFLAYPGSQFQVMSVMRRNSTDYAQINLQAVASQVALGLVQCCGPNGEEDYEDPRFYVGKARFKDVEPDDPLELELILNSENEPDIITVDNFCDWPDGHSLWPGQPVEYVPVSMPDGSQRYIMES